MKLRILTFALVGIFVYAAVSHAQITSTNYQIRWDTISTGGSDSSSSASYILRDSVTQSAGVRSSSASYKLDSGYRAGIFDQIISFDMFIQNTDTSRAATALAGNVITTSETGISVDDYVAVIQDVGENEVVGVGKVTSVSVGSVTVDRLVTRGVTPVINGSGDVLIILSAEGVGFQDLSTSKVSTGIIGFEVTAAVDSGYVVQVIESDDFKSPGGETLDDVLDGSVTAGSEEYGAISSDTTLANSTFDTQDSALTTSAQDIVTVSTFAHQDRNFLELKAAVKPATAVGTYSHILTFITSGNF